MENALGEFNLSFRNGNFAAHLPLPNDVPSCLAFVVGTILLVTYASASTNFISGEVTTGATWSGINLLTGTVIIRPNEFVTMEPSVRILMNTAAVLRVEGQRLASGTSNQLITFMSSTTNTNC